jgi:hypothetical protein
MIPHMNNNFDLDIVEPNDLGSRHLKNKLHLLAYAYL